MDDAANLADYRLIRRYGHLETKVELAALEALLAKCESPIESKLAEALFVVLCNEFPDGAVQLSPQYRLGPYRYDFAIILQGGPLFFIECDGRDFHSSPEQIERDHAKGKFAHESGTPCLRYAGSIIHKNPYVIAFEIARCVSYVLGRFLR